MRERWSWIDEEYHLFMSMSQRIQTVTEVDNKVLEVVLFFHFFHDSIILSLELDDYIFFALFDL